MNKMRPPYNWSVDFASKGSQLKLEHPAGIKVQGTLSLTGRGKYGEWRLEKGSAPNPAEISLLDGQGFRRGWLQPEIDGNTLRLHLSLRLMLRITGRMIFEGTITLGPNAFACRTMPQLGGQVVQMASGHADSGLNDSVFDLDRDLALRLSAARTQITTEELSTGKAQVFQFRMEAALDTDLSPALEFVAMPDFYRTRFAPDFTPITQKFQHEVATGWMSWNRYYGTAGEAENLAEARIGAEKLQPYGLKYWYIENWPKDLKYGPWRAGDYLTLKSSPVFFPSGMKWLAEEIRKLGFVPGIWSVPFGCGDDEFYAKHRSWFLHDAKGKPFSNWCGRYILDPSQPPVRKHVEKMYGKMKNEWGYELFKVDGVSANNHDYSSVFYENEEVRESFANKCDEPMRVMSDAIARGIGPEPYLLWCGGDPTGPEVRYGHGSRIGSDVVHPPEDPVLRNYLAQAHMTLVHLLFHNILWHNDPDTLLVGTYAPLNLARVATTIVGLPGQLMIASDKLAQLPEERFWLMQRCLPVCPTRPLDLFPIHDMKPIWDLKIRRPFGQWDVVSLFNFEEKNAAEIELQFEQIGLDPEGQYLVFDFWKQKFLGIKKNGIAATLAPQSNTLLAIHPLLPRPQFLSTDRHLTQGATSITAMTWNARQNLLKGSVDLVGGEDTSLYFHVPRGWSLQESKATKGVTDAQMIRANVLRLTLSAKKSSRANWSLRFKRV